MAVSSGRALDLGKRLFKDVGEHNLSGAAAELAYRFFLALFPFFIFLAALGGFVASAFNVLNPADKVVDLLGDSLPADVTSVLRTELGNVVESRNPGLLSIGILGALWAASSGVGSIIVNVNRVYGVRESRPFWKRYLISVGVTAFAGLGIVLGFALFFIGQVWGPRIASEIGLGSLAAGVLQAGRWVLVIAMLLTAVAIVYWALPNKRLPFRWITPGSVLFVIGWLLGTYLFGVYVSHFASYNATYGALGGIVILLIWFYLSSFLLLVGAEINALLTQEVEPEALPEKAGGDRLERDEPDAGTQGSREEPRPGEAPGARRRPGGGWVWSGRR